MVKFILYAVIAVLVALLAGYVWGSSGRSTLQSQLDAQQLATEVAQARASLLEARVDLFEVNFGQASRALESAKTWLDQAAGRAEKSEQADKASRLKNVAARLTQAQQQVGRLDQSANTTVAEAVKLVDQVVPAGQAQAAPGK